MTTINPHFDATRTKTTDEYAAAAAQMVEEITAMVADGTVPATVVDFGQLHDWCDANTLAGFCDEDARADWTTGDLIAVQDIVQGWLASRHLDDAALLVEIMRADEALSEDGSKRAMDRANLANREGDRRWGTDALELSANFFTAHHYGSEEITEFARTNPTRLFEIMGVTPSE